MILSGLLALPLLGAALLLLPGLRLRALRFIAGVATGATTLYAVGLLLAFNTAVPGVQFAESYPWNSGVGSYFALGLDGLSLPMVLLAAFLCFIAVLASGAIRHQARGYYLLVLLLESAMLGVFLARDWSLFYVFWELTLIPLFFLIDRWGGANRHRAALNFVLYTMGGAVFLLVALLLLYDHSAIHSFDMAALARAAAGLPQELQVAIFFGLLIGFGVKMPVFPLHGWLPLAHVEAPSPVSILLSGILLKMGSYGLLRSIETLPAAALALQNLLAALAFASLIYGGVLAWRQRDLKAMIAYSSVSHMGVVLLGLATLNTAGLTGAMVQMVAHGLVAGALFLLIGLLYERTHSRDIAYYSSLVRVMPRFAFFTVLAFVGAVGLPGTAGFVAELHALVGSFGRWQWWVLLLGLAMLISAAYAVRTIGRLFTGPVREPMRHIPDLSRAELAGAALLSGATLVFGLFPSLLLSVFSQPIAEIGRMFAGAP